LSIMASSSFLIFFINLLSYSFYTIFFCPSITSLKAASTGITLTRARMAVFAEFDWNPATILQAEDRIHRISQKNNVTCYYLACSNTIDEKMLESILKKIEAVKEISNMKDFSLLSLF